MSRDLKVLDRHFRHWRDKGLVTPEQEAGLRHASAELDRGAASTIVRTALGVLGGGLLLAGLILIVAENWGAIPRFAKLGVWAALQCAFLYLTHELGRRFQDRPYLAEALALVAGGWVLGGIALVSQIYHLDARPPNGIWLWLVLVVLVPGSTGHLLLAWSHRHVSSKASICAGLPAPVSSRNSTLYDWFELNGGSR